MAVAIAVAACELEAPKLASGDVAVYDGGRSSHSWQLSAAQLTQIQSWLNNHRGGWSRDLNSYAPKVLISMKAVDGSPWGINVFSTGVVINGGGHQLNQSFEAREIELLKSAAGVEHDG